MATKAKSRPVKKAAAKKAAVKAAKKATGRPVKAKARRAELIRSGEYGEFEDLAIDQITLVSLPTKELITALLNRRGFIAEGRQVVPPFVPKNENEGEE